MKGNRFFVKGRDYLLSKLLRHGAFDGMSDETFLRFYYPLVMGSRLELEHPRSYSEKLQWLKLHDRRDIYTDMVDKVSAKEFIADRVGREHVIPTLGVWEHFDEIDFERLPDSFVLKCSHDSGGMVKCESKASFQTEAARSLLESRLSKSYYLRFREWPYKNVRPRLLAETYLVEDPAVGPAPLCDYKFFCFNGEPRLMYISRDRGSDPRTAFFDMDFQALPLRMKDPPPDVLPDKPPCFDEMRAMARVLSFGVPALRVDFYYVDHTVYVGELTFFHNAGFVSISPPEWNMILGDWLVLPDKR